MALGDVEDSDPPIVIPPALRGSEVDDGEAPEPEEVATAAPVAIGVSLGLAGTEDLATVTDLVSIEGFGTEVLTCGGADLAEFRALAVCSLSAVAAGSSEACG